MGRKASEKTKHQGPPDPNLYVGDDETFYSPTVIDGTMRCCAACKQCKCGFSFKKEKIPKSVRACPECGRDRRCYMEGKSPNNRCRYHFGKIAQGPAHHRFVHGRTSKLLASLPPQYLEFARELAANPDDVLSNVNELIIGVVRTKDLIERLGTGENRQWIQLLQFTWNEFATASKRLQSARIGGDQDEIAAAQLESQQALESLGQTINKAANVERAWVELWQHAGMMSKLRSEEAKIVDLQSRTMNAEQAWAYGAMLRQAVMDVLDPEIHKSELTRIVGRLNDLLAGRGQPINQTGRYAGPIAGRIGDGGGDSDSGDGDNDDGGGDGDSVVVDGSVAGRDNADGDKPNGGKPAAAKKKRGRPPKKKPVD